MIDLQQEREFIKSLGDDVGLICDYVDYMQDFNSLRLCPRNIYCDEIASKICNNNILCHEAADDDLQPALRLILKKSEVVDNATNEFI